MHDDPHTNDDHQCRLPCQRHWDLMPFPPPFPKRGWLVHALDRARSHRRRGPILSGPWIALLRVNSHVDLGEVPHLFFKSRHWCHLSIRRYRLSRARVGVERNGGIPSSSKHVGHVYDLRHVPVVAVAVVAVVAAMAAAAATTVAATTTTTTTSTTAAK